MLDDATRDVNYFGTEKAERRKVDMLRAMPRQILNPFKRRVQPVGIFLRQTKIPVGIYGRQVELAGMEFHVTSAEEVRSIGCRITLQSAILQSAPCGIDASTTSLNAW